MSIITSLRFLHRIYSSFTTYIIDPLQEKDWKITKDEYLTDNWDHIIFSVRSKGMPGEKSENPKKAYETYKNKKAPDYLEPNSILIY